MEQERDNWKNYAVDGHFHSSRPWISYHRLATEGFAELTGARAQEVVAMNTLTVNLHILMASFYRPTADRYKIVIEKGAFPSDNYAAASQLRMHGFDPAHGAGQSAHDQTLGARANNHFLLIESEESARLSHRLRFDIRGRPTAQAPGRCKRFVLCRRRSANRRPDRSPGS